MSRALRWGPTMWRRNRAAPTPDVPPDAGDTFAATVDDWALEVVREARPYTMTSIERLVAVIDATEYVLARQIPGAFVECGVWRGGSILAMVRALQHAGVEDRDLYLFDTFEGMTAPTEEDRSRFDGRASDHWAATEQEGGRVWNELFRPEVFNLDDVRAMLHATGYPVERLHFVAGPVEATLPAQAPAGVALLRLDTDWYESTKHELTHLYPRLATNGVLIVDDYGHWQGCRQAVDEYFAATGAVPMFARTDYTGRLAVKTG